MQFFITLHPQFSFGCFLEIINNIYLSRMRRLTVVYLYYCLSEICLASYILFGDCLVTNLIAAWCNRSEVSTDV